MKNKPKITLKYMEEVNLEDLDFEYDVEYKKISNCEIEKEIKKIEFNSCIFEKVDFLKSKIEKIDLIDCIFNNCDLSNAD